jgi:prenyltransferase beta subunit
MTPDILRKSRKWLIERLRQLQKPAGYWDEPSNSLVLETAAAALALHLCQSKASERALDFLSTCINEDGGCGFAKGEVSDLDSSNAVLAVFRMCAGESRSADRAKLETFCSNSSMEIEALPIRLLQFLGGGGELRLPPIDPERLPTFDRIVMEVVQGTLSRNSTAIFAPSRVVDGLRSWRGVITVTGIACAGLAKLGVRDEAAVCWLEKCQNSDGGFPLFQSLGCWETSVASLALFDAGVEPQSVDWLLSAQRSDGGWTWDVEGRGGVDFDDTGYALWAILRGGVSRSDTRVQRAMALLCESQNSDGGFPTFEKANNKVIPRLYWNQSVPDVTSHVLPALKAAGMTAEADRAERWLIDAGADGLWKGQWFKGDLYSTVSVLEAIDKSRIDLRKTCARVLALQNQDGSFGDPGKGTIEETAWGIGALLEAGGPRDPVDRAMNWLVERYQESTPSRVAVGWNAAWTSAKPTGPREKRYSDLVLTLAWTLSAFNKVLARQF